jgi:hypothetical protein
MVHCAVRSFARHGPVWCPPGSGGDGVTARHPSGIARSEKPLDTSAWNCPPEQAGVQWWTWGSGSAARQRSEEGDGPPRHTSKATAWQERLKTHHPDSHEKRPDSPIRRIIWLLPGGLSWVAPAALPVGRVDADGLWSGSAPEASRFVWICALDRRRDPMGEEQGATGLLQVGRNDPLVLAAVC